MRAQRRPDRARHQRRRDADSRCRPRIGAHRQNRAPDASWENSPGQFIHAFRRNDVAATSLPRASRSVSTFRDHSEPPLSHAIKMRFRCTDDLALTAGRSAGAISPARSVSSSDRPTAQTPAAAHATWCSGRASSVTMPVSIVAPLLAEGIGEVELVLDGHELLGRAAHTSGWS